MLFDVAGKEEMGCSDVYAKHRVDRWLLIPDGVVGQPDRRDHWYSGRGSELLRRPFLFIMLCASVLSTKGEQKSESRMSAIILEQEPNT